MGNPRNSKSQIELSLERELDVLVKVSISLQSEFDPESLFSVILVKVSIWLQSELDPESASGSHVRRRLEVSGWFGGPKQLTTDQHLLVSNRF